LIDFRWEDFSVKKGIFFLVLSLSLLTFGCDLFSPQSSKGTIEVSNTYLPTSGYTGCTVYANVDGGNTVIVGNGSVYSFPLVSTGMHTVNMNTESSYGCNTLCTISGANSNGNYADTFQVNSGDLYVVKLANAAGGNSCYDLVVSGP
jgi:hypothetical protein